MVSVSRTKAEDPSRATRYEAIGGALLKTAQDLSELLDARYGNAIAIVSIHAAIALTDALTVAYRHVKSTDGDHTRAADLLVHALGHRAEDAQVRRLRGILNAKSTASYSGTYYTVDDGIRVLNETRTYAEWARGMLRSRP